MVEERQDRQRILRTRIAASWGGTEKDGLSTDMGGRTLDAVTGDRWKGHKETPSLKELPYNERIAEGLR